VRKPSKPSGPYTKVGLEQFLKDKHAETGGGYTRQDDLDMQNAGTGYGQFTFYKKLPGEVRAYLEGRPELKSLFTLTDRPSDSGGEDAMSSLGPDRYFELAEKMVQGKGAEMDEAVANAKAHPDPEVQFKAHVYEAIQSYEGKKPKTELADPDSVKIGEQFEYMGHPFEVVEGEGGYRVLKDGREFPEVPVEALDKVPMDKGTRRQAEPEVPDAETDVASELPTSGAFDKIEQWAERRIATKQKAQAEALAKAPANRRRQRGSAGSTDPEELALRAVIGAARIGQKFTRFADWSKSMLKRFPDMTKDALRDVWRKSRRLFAMPEEDRAEWIKSQFTVPQTKTTKGIIRQNVDRGMIERAVKESDVLMIRLRSLARGERPASRWVRRPSATARRRHSKVRRWSRSPARSNRA
jgi:hypothetical protein